VGKRLLIAGLVAGALVLALLGLFLANPKP
jgi:hypothetical protein